MTTGEEDGHRPAEEEVDRDAANAAPDSAGGTPAAGAPKSSYAAALAAHASALKGSSPSRVGGHQHQWKELDANYDRLYDQVVVKSCCFACGRMKQTSIMADANSMAIVKHFQHLSIHSSMLRLAAGGALVYPGSAPTTDLPHEHKFGEITAYRCWKMIGGQLFSCYNEEAHWKEREPQGSAEGDLENGLGIHAWTSLREAIRYADCYAGSSEKIVVGTVALWGEVVEHEKGYRAQWAKPLEFMMIKGGGATTEELGWLRYRWGFREDKPKVPPIVFPQVEKITKFLWLVMMIIIFSNASIGIAAVLGWIK